MFEYSDREEGRAAQSRMMQAIYPHDYATPAGRGAYTKHGTVPPQGSAFSFHERVRLTVKDAAKVDARIVQMLRLA